MGEGLTDYKVKQIIEALKGIERQLKIANKMNAERNANSAAIVLGEIKPPKKPIDPMGYTE